MHGHAWPLCCVRSTPVLTSAEGMSRSQQTRQFHWSLFKWARLQSAAWMTRRLKKNTLYLLRLLSFGYVLHGRDANPCRHRDPDGSNAHHLSTWHYCLPLWPDHYLCYKPQLQRNAESGPAWAQIRTRAKGQCFSPFWFILSGILLFKYFAVSFVLGRQWVPSYKTNLQ